MKSLVQVINESISELKHTQIEKIECDIALSDKKSTIKLIIDSKGNILNLSDIKKFDGEHLEFREGYTKIKIYFTTGDVWEYESDVPNCISVDYKEMDFEIKGKKLSSFNKIDKRQFGYMKGTYEYEMSKK